jgi:hypothetical protein
VVDISKFFETTDGEIIFLDENGRQLYHDAGHLSAYGAERIKTVIKQALIPPR